MKTYTYTYTHTDRNKHIHIRIHKTQDTYTCTYTYTCPHIICVHHARTPRPVETRSVAADAAARSGLPLPCPTVGLRLLALFGLAA